MLVNDDLQALNGRLEVLEAAEKVISEWTQDYQKEPLRKLSMEIAELARDFGVSQLMSVKLDGGARMKISMGGQAKGYSECDSTAQMRLKVATAVALLRRGFDTGIGRHPGLLMVDAPGTEEAYPDNLATMLEALRVVAKDSPNMQVFVASTAVDVLEQVIEEPAHRRIAAPGEYLW